MMQDSNNRNLIRNKLHSKAGESLAETLIALLIAALAVAMLAGSIGAASNMVTRSREKLRDYYRANEIMVKSGDASDSEYVSKEDVTVNIGSIPGTFTAEMYGNTAFGNKPVYAYKFKSYEP